MSVCICPTIVSKRKTKNFHTKQARLLVNENPLVFPFLFPMPVRYLLTAMESRHFSPLN